jgi:DNA-directed RNA polymerase subunit RPC12/RpoP
VPSLIRPKVHLTIPENVVREDDDEPIEIQIETEDPLNNDSCGLCKSSSCLIAVDDFHIGLIHKCLPLVAIQGNFLQKLCKNCISILETFSMFIDKILTVQNNACLMVQQDYVVPDSNVIQNHRIKVEPLANIEEEVKIPSIQVMDFAQEPRVSNQFTKKCEILEIVDIKPFNFDGVLQQENYEDEDEIQILSPKQLKVEIDPDEDGSNELEQIMNYVFISQVFLQDHNYTKIPDETVKIEDDDSNIEAPDTTRICSICSESFKSFKKLLIHKIVSHRANRSKLKHRKQIVCSKKQQQMRKLCSKIIQQKKQKMIKENEKPPQNQQRRKVARKSYECPTCGKTFPGSKNLYQHKISHTVSNYSCGLCEKKFKRAHGLKQHFKSIHENEKNFECAICGHRYLLKADMQKCRHRALKKMS